MEKNNKNLVLLVDYLDLNCVNRQLIEESDRVAITTDAMHTFKENGFSYKTFEDIYSRGQFRRDNARLMESTESLLLKLDEAYESHLGFNRVFRGNILYFML